MAVDSAALFEAVESLHGEWREGFGPGATLYRIETDQSVVFVNDESVTVLDRGTNHLEDPKGEMAAAVAEMLFGVEF